MRELDIQQPVLANRPDLVVGLEREFGPLP
jgi:hypothetical protein